ncbi:unnamed protein product [Calicophoron daubneyi]|uniref:RRM domain-containing protein n=1 Tax=Calicophoron daubneyi TaxID=300641 RepID=A0AAV2T9W5_CALDB
MDPSVKYAVLKLSRLPPHFCEKEVFAYLRQFGKVEAVYMPRSKKTLKHKGYGFAKVEKDVAPIIASTVDGVLNFNKIMKCEVLSDPKWGVFRRRPQTKDNRSYEIKKQTTAALKRIVTSNSDHTEEAPKSSKPSAPTRKNHALRRRTRSFEKRIKSLQESNSEFRFKLAYQ